jgi:hypothetical protein
LEGHVGSGPIGSAHPAQHHAGTEVHSG